MRCALCGKPVQETGIFHTHLTDVLTDEEIAAFALNYGCRTDQASRDACRENYVHAVLDYERALTEIEEEERHD